MEFFLQIVIGVAVALLSSIVLKLQMNYEVGKKQRDCDSHYIKLGVQALLRDRMIQMYEYNKNKGYITKDSLNVFLAEYNAYHNLGKNGVMDIVRDKVIALANNEPEEIGGA